MSRRIELALRVGLSLFLAATAALKIGASSAETYALPVWSLQVVAIVELAAAALLWSSRAGLALAIVVLLATCGTLHARFRAPERSCGCLGHAVEIDRHQEMALAGALGVTALTICGLRELTRRPRP